MDLFLRKYTKNIVIVGNHKLKDIETGVCFYILKDHHRYVFKEANDHIWVTRPVNLNINGTCYDPQSINGFSVEDGLKCTFASKEEIIQRATDYFRTFFRKKMLCSYFRYSDFILQGSFYKLEYIFFRSKEDPSLKVEYAYN